MKLLTKITSSYCDDTAGNFSVILTVTLSAILMATGAAMDLSQAYSVKSQYQDYADSAILAAASSGETKREKLKAHVKAWSSMNLADSDRVKFAKKANDISVTISTDYTPKMMSMFGFKSIPVEVSAHSVLPSANDQSLNVAFVLDTTASMSGEKITALREATSSFIDEIEPSLRTNQSKVSIVPFADYVRLPLSYGSATWIDVQPPVDKIVRTVDGENSVNCRQVGSGENVYTECDYTAYTEAVVTKAWMGCMGSRRGNYHKIADYSGKNMQGFNGDWAHCYDTYNFLSPLSNDSRDLKEKIANLGTAGDTYIPAGLLWGWRTLSPNEPFTESLSTKDTDTKNLLVLMSDGANTASLRGEDGEMLYHWGQPVNQKDSDAKNKAAANTLTLEICNNIKAANIEIVTIAYDLDDAVTVAMLQNCATSPDKAYKADTAAELKTAFKNISKVEANVRITK